MKNFIVGTDWWTDCDDAVAMRILARAHNEKRISLKAIGINACMEHSVTSLAGFLASENVFDVPIGIDLEATDFGGNPPYQQRLSKISSSYKSNADAYDSVKLYRKILSQANEPIEIIEIGYPQVIVAVLNSAPDDISPKSGMELIKEKVTKIWMMAGKWDVECGKENNFARNERSKVTGNIFCKICPVPVTFLGWEIGYDVISGGELKKDDVLYMALSDHKSYDGRSSWDPMLVVMAIEGDESKAGYDVVRGYASVDEITGENTFIKDDNGLHSYVIKTRSNDYYKDVINELIK